MKLNPYDAVKAGLRNKKTRWFIILLVVVYVLSPVDILPELFTTVFGLIDDGVLVALLVSELVTIRKESRLEKQQQNTSQSRVVEGEVTHSDDVQK